jgi:hypothetical protein
MMRTCIFALAAIIPAFAIDRAGAADGPPAFDIARNCRAEVIGAVTATTESCSKDETDAKNELTKRWSEFSASSKKSCIGEADIGGDKSYVELLTCLEMTTGQFRPQE